MSSLTFTKTLLNPQLFVSVVQNLLTTNTISYYQYDTSNSLLTLYFKTIPDTTTSQMVTTLVTNYNETHALNLSTQQMAAYKFAQYTMSKDTLISGATDVPFQVENNVDRLYYTMSSNNYVYIQKPGTYLVIARLTTDFAAGSTNTPTGVSYELQYDDTRTEKGYLTYPNTAVYTTHRSITNGSESTVLSCVLTVNSQFGTYVKIVANRITGTGTVQLKGNFTSILFMNIPNAAFYEGNITSTVNVSNSFQNLFFGNRRIVNYPFTHNVGQASVTIQNSGWLLLIAKSTFTKTSGTDNTQAALRFFSLGLNSQMSGTSGYSTEIITGMKSTSNFIGMIPVNSGTQITYQTMMTQGSNLQMTAGESGYLAVFFNASLYPQLSLLNAFTDVTQTLGPVLSGNTPVDLTFTTLRTLQPAAPNNVINFSTSTPEITVNDTGLFLITAHISVTNPTQNNGTMTVFLTSSIDGGQKYLPIIGSYVTRNIGRGDKTSATTMAIAQVSSGHRIKVQASSSNDVLDLNQFADSCTISLCKFVTSTLASSKANAATSVFGNNFHVVTSKDPITISTSNPVEKCRLVTGYIPAGIYRVGSRADYVLQSTNETAQYILTHYGSNGTVTTLSNQQRSTTQTTFMTLDYIFVPEGINTFTMQLASLNGTPLTIQNAFIEFWQVA